MCTILGLILPIWLVLIKSYSLQSLNFVSCWQWIFEPISLKPSNLIYLGILWSCFVVYSVLVSIANSCAPQRRGRLKFIRKWNHFPPSCKSWRSDSLEAIQTTSDSLKSACQIYADLKWHTEQTEKGNALMNEQWIRDPVWTRKYRHTWPEATFYSVYSVRTSLLQPRHNCSWSLNHLVEHIL